MFKFLYSLGVKFYYLMALIASIFNEKAKLWINGRKNIFDKLNKENFQISTNIWFHVSSLGEFEQARPLIEKIKEEHFDYKIILTFFSPSGFEIRKDYKFADFVSYLPLDSKKNANKFISLINPKKVFFVKYDYWFYYLKELYKRKIDCFLVSGIFLENQLFFKKIGKWYTKMLKYFTYFFVQNNQSLELLKSINIENVKIAGDTRFDRVIQIADNAVENDIIKSFVGNKKCLIAGSTWLEDEQLLAKFINKSDDLKFIIAPHEINENHIISLLQLFNRPTVRYSRAAGTDLTDYQVMLIDNIGMLSSLYKYGDIAYIGGGFGAGIHNIIEAAVYGMPVLFGHNYKKFQEAYDLIDLKVAYSVRNYLELKNKLNMFCSDNNYLESVSKKAKDYVYQNKGASEIVISNVFKD